MKTIVTSLSSRCSFAAGLAGPRGLPQATRRKSGCRRATQGRTATAARTTASGGLLRAPARGRALRLASDGGIFTIVSRVVVGAKGQRSPESLAGERGKVHEDDRQGHRRLSGCAVACCRLGRTRGTAASRQYKKRLKASQYSKSYPARARGDRKPASSDKQVGLLRAHPRQGRRSGRSAGGASTMSRHGTPGLRSLRSWKRTVVSLIARCHWLRVCRAKAAAATVKKKTAARPSAGGVP